MYDLSDTIFASGASVLASGAYVASQTFVVSNLGMPNITTIKLIGLLLHECANLPK